MKFFCLIFVLAFTACSKSKPTVSEVFAPNAIVYTGAKWPNISNIPVCVVNRGEVSDELANDIHWFVSNEFRSKAGIILNGWAQCNPEQMSQTMIRIHYRRMHNWDGDHVSGAGHGLSWIGPNPNSCGGECGGGTMYVGVGSRGAYSTGVHRQYTIHHTRATALHEFGHALGLAHEHERNDAPRCRDIHGALPNAYPWAFVGGYDPESIMNYCKRDEVNWLSQGDVAGLAYLYGKAPPPNGSAPAANGVYVFVNAASNKCLDVAGASLAPLGRIQSWDCIPGGIAQKFRLLPGPEDSYRIQSVHSGLCLDVLAGSPERNARVVQYNCHDGGNQRTRVTAGANGTYSFRFDHSNRCLDLSEGGTTRSGADYLQWDCTGNPNQFFRLIPAN